MTPTTSKIPSAPRRRSSSIAREEFLTSDNSAASIEQLQLNTIITVKQKNDNQELTGNQHQINAQQKHQDEPTEEEALREKFAELNIDDLKKRLRRRNCAVGPMDGRNRKIYEAKLAKIERKENDNVAVDKILLKPRDNSISRK